jgi:hypothetical protein
MRLICYSFVDAKNSAEILICYPVQLFYILLSIERQIIKSDKIEVRNK